MKQQNIQMQNGLLKINTLILSMLMTFLVTGCQSFNDLSSNETKQDFIINDYCENPFTEYLMPINYLLNDYTHLSEHDVDRSNFSYSDYFIDGKKVFKCLVENDGFIVESYLYSEPIYINTMTIRKNVYKQKHNIHIGQDEKDIKHLLGNYTLHYFRNGYGKSMSFYIISTRYKSTFYIYQGLLDFIEISIYLNK